MPPARSAAPCPAAPAAPPAPAAAAASSDAAATMKHASLEERGVMSGVAHTQL